MMDRGDGGIRPPQPPVQRKDLDLSTHPDDSDNPARLGRTPNEYKSPADIMRAMGFDPTGTMTPLQFMVAVYNDDLAKIYRDEKKRKRTEDQGGIGMSYRVECAKTAAKYIHMQMPQVTIAKDGDANYGNDLAKNIAKGGERIRTKRVILETVERISPDMPLPPAQYPPALAEHIEGRIIDIEPSAEGDMNYDPDAEA